MRTIFTLVPRSFALGILIAAGCAPASQHAYVAPTHLTIVSATEESQGEQPVHTIYIENRSTVPVTVFAIRLSACENVKQQCEPRPVKLRVAPGRRELAIRVEPASTVGGFTYHFGFSWNADSAGVSALSALANNGDTGARSRLTAMERADSLERQGGGLHFHELSREDFAALSGRAASLQAATDSLVIEPGESYDIDRIALVVADSQGVVLGRTHWVRYQVMTGSQAIAFIPPRTIIGRAVGRASVRFQLSDEAQALLRNPIPDDVNVAIVVGYPADPHAPSFEGVAVDADTKSPLACARVALEDSLENVVARARTDARGAFVLRAPRAGSYHVRVEINGWTPVHGPLETAADDQTMQHRYPIRFTEQLLVGRYSDPGDYQPSYPAAVAAASYTPQRPAGGRKKAGTGTIIRGVSLRGSGSMPILNVVGNARPGTTWVQFVVDSLGQVVAGSIGVPPTADAASLESVNVILPHVRFSPAKEMHRPTCELVRMQVNFSPR